MDQLTFLGSLDFESLHLSIFIFASIERYTVVFFDSHVIRVFTCGRHTPYPRRTSRRLLPWRRISAILYAAIPTAQPSPSTAPFRPRLFILHPVAATRREARAAIETVRGTILTRRGYVYRARYHVLAQSKLRPILTLWSIFATLRNDSSTLRNWHILYETLESFRFSFLQRQIYSLNSLWLLNIVFKILFLYI